MSGRLWPAAGLAAALVTGCAQEPEPGAHAAENGTAAVLPDTIRIAEPGLHPEGVEWDASRGRFLVSSVTTGRITSVGDDGSLEVLASDPDVSAAIGIHVDAVRDRVLVASATLGAIGDPTNPGHAALAVYDLATGERQRHIELGSLRPEGRHFANDVTVAEDGTIYVTDSLSPVIYRITPDGEASVFVEDARLGAEPVGLNGIDWHPDGYLLAAVMGRSALVRIPVDAPSELTEVVLSEPISADGLYLSGDGTLLAVGSTRGADGTRRPEVLWLRSPDGWESAEIVGRAPSGGATTGVLRGGAAYVVNPHFEALGAEEPHPVFEIYRVEPGSE